MKKMMTALTLMLLTAATAHAMSYEQARNEALFLTDKMAYELNLTDEQYEAAYEINLDYLMGVATYDDVFGPYWERRNLDLSYVLFDWQWNTFRAASYFYRPLYWSDGYWHFSIYARYPHRDYFYFGRPVFYASYRGGHAWHVVGGHGYYYAHRDHYRPAPTAHHTHFGMLDRWNRGDFGSGRSIGHPSHGSFGGYRNSSTRTTVHHNEPRTHHDNTGIQHNPTRPNGNFGQSSSHTDRTFGHSSSHTGGSFGGSRSSHSSSGTPSHSFGSSSHSSGHNHSGSHGTGSSGRSFGGRR